MLKRSLEYPLRSGGDAQQSRAGPALRSGSDTARGTVGVVTIGGNAASACSQIEVRARSVKGRRRVDIPRQVLAELPFPGRSDHIRLVLIGSDKVSRPVGGRKGGVVVLTGIALRAEGMRPTEMQ